MPGMHETVRNVPRLREAASFNKSLHRTPGLRFGFNVSIVGPASVSPIVRQKDNRQIKREVVCVRSDHGRDQTIAD